ncbi:MAG: 16S rRNA (guanine(966)-N(2))-methyltransferase RsmD [Candidatus Kuenenia sp.]|nr:16S rRNA (guanine(966)-N(2))-methyltransferase RsmD [Candidatus Kuenenia hertensis]
MRVIAGSVRGVLLYSPKGSKTRPMSDNVKESLFNILAHIIPGSNVLDLYAGTGSVGIEALSRGAKFCLFAENDKFAIQTIKKNITVTKLLNYSKIIKCDVLKLIPFLEQNTNGINIVFACPPYPLIDKYSYREKLLIFLSSLYERNIVCSEGVIVFQHRKTLLEIPPQALFLTLYDTRIYRETQLSFFKKTLR